LKERDKYILITLTKNCLKEEEDEAKHDEITE